MIDPTTLLALILSTPLLPYNYLTHIMFFQFSTHPRFCPLSRTMKPFSPSVPCILQNRWQLIYNLNTLLIGLLMKRSWEEGAAWNTLFSGLVRDPKMICGFHVLNSKIVLCSTTGWLRNQGISCCIYFEPQAGSFSLGFLNNFPIGFLIAPRLSAFHIFEIILLSYFFMEGEGVILTYYLYLFGSSLPYYI